MAFLVGIRCRRFAYLYLRWLFITQSGSIVQRCYRRRFYKENRLAVKSETVLHIRIAYEIIKTWGWSKQRSLSQSIWSPWGKHEKRRNEGQMIGAFGTRGRLGGGSRRWSPELQCLGGSKWVGRNQVTLFLFCFVFDFFEWNRFGFLLMILRQSSGFLPFIPASFQSVFWCFRRAIRNLLRVLVLCSVFCDNWIPSEGDWILVA